MKFELDHLSNNFKGIILAIMGFSAFAMADANAKYLTTLYKPEHVVGIVAIFSSALCVFLAPFLGGIKKTLQTQKLKFHIWRGLMNAVISLLVVYAFSKLTLAATYSMIFMTPFIVTMLCIPIFKEKVHVHGWIAILGGFIGVLIVVRPGADDLNPYLLIPLAAAFFIAILFMLARPLDKNETLISLAFYPVVTNLILITPVILYLYGMPEIKHLFLFFVQALLVITALMCTSTAFRIAKASIVSPFIYIEIIWAIGFDFFIFRDPPALWTLLGGAIIIASGIYLIETERKTIKLDVEHV